ncbi:MAG: hypothetical protein ACMG6S_00820 [Byssovorax sp.]
MAGYNGNGESNSEAGVIAARALGGRRIRVLAHGGQGSKYLAQDDRHLYWADSWDNTVTRLPKDGGIPLVLVTEQRNLRALTLADGWLHWTCQDKVARMPAEGGDVEVIADDPETPWDIIVHEGTVVWTTYGDHISGGCVKMKRAGEDRVITLAEQQKQPPSLAVDAQRVYWANHGVKRPTYFKDGSVACAPWSGGGRPDIIAKDQPLASSIAVDDAWIYWMTATTYDEPHVPGALWKRRKEGGEIIQLASWDWIEAGTITLDATHVYWMSPIHALLFRVRKEGGEPEQLMAAVPGNAVSPSSLFVDERCVYWAARDSQRAGGAVFKMAK